MLSFMKESDSGAVQVQPPQGQVGDTGCPAESQDFLTVADRGKTVRNSTVLVAILFGLGLLGVWFMVQKIKPNTAGAAEVSSGEAEIEGAISRLTGVSSEMMTRMDKIVKKFYEFSEVYQVEVDELSKNPFSLESTSPPGGQGEAEETRTEEEKAHADLMKKLTQQTKALSLVGIMQVGNGKRCMIGDDILKLGDAVGEFRVMSIGADQVELEWIPVGVDVLHVEPNDTQVTLKLSE